VIHLSLSMSVGRVFASNDEREAHRSFTLNSPLEWLWVGWV